MKAVELARSQKSVGAKSRLHSKSPFKIAEGANRRRKLVLTPVNAMRLVVQSSRNSDPS